uniref:(northern house mosquito) hypothetical protein n=1 Tax=Culex pipiens TaxID=7175 RepID=A0A8D8AEQ0_CULPI
MDSKTNSNQIDGTEQDCCTRSFFVRRDGTALGFCLAQRYLSSLTELPRRGKSRILCCIVLFLILKPAYAATAAACVVFECGTRRQDLHVSLNGCSFRCLLLEYFEVL